MLTDLVLIPFLFGRLKSFASLILCNQAHNVLIAFFKGLRTYTHTNTYMQICTYIHTYNTIHRHTYLLCMHVLMLSFTDIFNLLIFLHPYHGLADASESHDKFTNIRTLAPYYGFMGANC